ncbi:hypothetical protein KR76_27475 [Pimelobacter simplex]|uniref:Uncharacterized protein n=2 Tax=Nocardioides simplex TaxID=2045 RepID=A0A0A1DQ92_NOCSI|nr:hypothetical protein KR76_27475 [Pimelobacter simplex]GEB15260.1 hypothetical protein NSI01_35750 [Pimelobacter simplex]SFM84469.1 Response regulator receiver domain-containing protein [Pimelobacter simplex]
MNTIHVLVADNDPDVEKMFNRQLEEYELSASISYTYADSADAAIEAAQAQFFHIAFIDLRLSERDKSEDGLVVLQHVVEKSRACVPVLMTRFVKENFAKVAHETTSMTGGRIYLLNKSDQNTAQFPTFIHNFFQDRLDARWTPDVPADAVDLLLRKNRRAPSFATRGRTGIVHEVRDLLFDLFDESSSMGVVGNEFRVDLTTMTPGLSSSITLRARPNFGQDSQGRQILGNRCVVKIGPRDGIHDEAVRYNRLVKLGVPTEFRVELIGTALGDLLGAVCYSFAGGTASDDIVSLDDLVRRGERDEVERVLTSIYGRDSKSWYAIAGADTAMQTYYKRQFGVTTADAIGALHQFVEKHQPAGAYVRSAGKLNLNGFTMTLPRESDLGTGAYYRAGSTPTRLIHGDLHGGNVLVDDTGRVSLIDYATADFGPRFADVAATLATLRLQVASAAEPVAAASAYQDERRLLSQRELREEPADLWWGLSRVAVQRASENFESDDERDSAAALRLESVMTQLHYALSIFPLPVWDEWQRWRLVTWIAALHDFASKADKR